MNTTTDNAQGLRALVRLFTSGYANGHHDTVEGQFTDVHQSDVETYFEEQVREILAEPEYAVLATHPPQQERAAVPDGWVLVPRVPTEKMICMGIEAYEGRCEDSYVAMIAAAPAAPATPDRAELEDVDREDFMTWLVREMPAGTVIGDPRWWAPKIARAFRFYNPSPVATPEGAEPVAWQRREYRRPNGSILPANEVGAWSECKGGELNEIRSLPPERCRFELRALFDRPTPAASDGGLRAALESIVRCAYPVDKSINRRGYDWDFSRLDEAIADARSVLATPQASTPAAVAPDPIADKANAIEHARERLASAAVAPEQVTDADLTERLREWNKSRGYIDDQCVYAVLKQCEALIASRVAPAGLGVAVTDDMERMFSVVGEEVTSDTLVDVIDQAIHNELLGADGSVHLEEWVRLRRWHIDIAAQQKGGGQ